MDKKKCIVLDYSETSLLAHWVRDEIRKVAPRTYLGKVYLGKKRLIFKARLIMANHTRVIVLTVNESVRGTPGDGSAEDPHQQLLQGRGQRRAPVEPGQRQEQPQVPGLLRVGQRPRQGLQGQRLRGEAGAALQQAESAGEPDALGRVQEHDRPDPGRGAGDGA